MMQTYLPTATVCIYMCILVQCRRAADDLTDVLHVASKYTEHTLTCRHVATADLHGSRLLQVTLAIRWLYIVEYQVSYTCIVYSESAEQIDSLGHLLEVDLLSILEGDLSVNEHLISGFLYMVALEG